MKLIYAIIRNDNEDDVIQALMQDHFVVTRLSTTGGFLKKGNTTLMIAVEDSDASMSSRHSAEEDRKSR